VKAKKASQVTGGSRCDQGSAKNEGPTGEGHATCNRKEPQGSEAAALLSLSQIKRAAKDGCRPDLDALAVRQQDGIQPLDGQELFYAHVHLHGGPAPVRRFLPELIKLVWAGKIDPGKVFDLTLPLDQVAEGYRAMDERRAIKTLLRPNS
jgi:threonine dehydrogenase-like Zn-dependent dehydrogenase